MIWSTPTVAALAAALGERTGLDFPPSRVGFADLGIRRVIAKAGERDAAALLARLDRDRALFQRLLAEVTVGETYFFRDTAQFEVLRTLIVPEIAARADGVPLRVWSAGCSTGEEPYSLAILFEELGRHEARIVATDVCATAIEAARRGRYHPRSFRDGLDPAALPAFTPVGKHWLIDEGLRRGVTFAVDNLIDPQLGGERFDLIVCRNVLIYFAPAAVARAAEVLIDRLAPGGWLLTSPTDPILPPRDGVEQLLTDAGIVYHHHLQESGGATPIPVIPSVGSRSEPTSRDRRNRRIHGNRPPTTIDKTPQRKPQPTTDVHAQRQSAIDTHVAVALDLLDRGLAAEALVEARRARYLDRACPVAHLAVARALRLCGRRDAARGALRRSGTLLAQRPPDEPVPRAGGLSAGALAALVAAELQIAAHVGAAR